MPTKDQPVMQISQTPCGARATRIVRWRDKFDLYVCEKHFRQMTRVAKEAGISCKPRRLKGRQAKCQMYAT